MSYLVDNPVTGWSGWYTTEQLRHMASLMPEDGDYQLDSPEAEFITGYNTDSYADELCELVEGLWDYYVMTVDEPSMDDFLEMVWDDSDYQLLHTWLRVTNLHIDDDEDIRQFALDCDRGTLEYTLERRDNEVSV